jgi:hypothetical protein
MGDGFMVPSIFQLPAKYPRALVSGPGLATGGWANAAPASVPESAIAASTRVVVNIRILLLMTVTVAEGTPPVKPG